MIKRTICLLLLLILSLIALLGPSVPANAVNNFVITNIVADDAGGMIIVSGKSTGNVADYKVTKLDAPDRLVVDIPNAVLSGQRQQLNISDTGVKSVKIAQFSTLPAIVRIVITADNAENIKKVSLYKSENSLIFKLNNVQVKKYTPTVVYQEGKIDTSKYIKPISQVSSNTTQVTQPLVDLRNYDNQNMVINSVKPAANQITLSGTGSFSIKEPFILKDPNRLVIDILNSTVSNVEIFKTYPLNATDSVEIGQFDPEILRVVVHSANPDAYKVVISPDLQTLIIAMKTGLNMENIPDRNNFGQVQNINVQKIDDDTTLITLTTSQPIVHSIKRTYTPNRINLELYNINAPNKAMITGLLNTEEFSGLNIDYLDKYPLGSNWSIPIKKGTKIKSQLSMDGKVLTLTMKSIKSIVIRSKGKVVIDAGHGGNEPGAQRVGIYEKNMTLDVAKKVSKYLSDAGVDVIMTRDIDKTVSLKERTDITNKENPDAFVSIHINACTSPSISGLETHMYHPQSRNLATVVHQSMVGSIPSPNRGIIKSKFYVINHTEVPAILVEIGFISCDAERYQMLSEERQEITAKAIADGIVQYLEMKRK